MTNIQIFIHGIYPRSQNLVQVSRDVERGRYSPILLDQQRKKDLEFLLKIQKSYDFDHYEDGKLTWQDCFRPIIEATKGIEAGPLTRFFDNNCFYRQPIIFSKIQIDLKKLDKFFPEIKPHKKWKVTLPSPFLFAKLSYDKKTDKFEQTLNNLTELTAKIIDYLSLKNVEIIQLNEPYIPYLQVEKKELQLYKKTLNVLNQYKHKSRLGVHFYFGDAKNAIKTLINDSQVDIVGIDFYKTDLTDLPSNVPFDIIAGVIDGQNSLFEDKKTLISFLKKAQKKLSPRNLYIANNSDLELLPESVAREKLKIISNLRVLLNKKT